MRGLLLLVTALCLVAGCGARVDTTKVTYPRTTVPAGQLPGDGGGGPGTTAARADDPAFTPDKLRTIDPCALLDTDLLDEFGKPAEPHRGDFAECANYMQDDAGKDLNITVTVGDSLHNALDADGNIGGLPALETTLDSGDACFAAVVTSTSPDLGIQVQANGESDDLCAVSRAVLTSVVERIRTDPPHYDLASGTLIEVDACQVLDAETVSGAIGSAEGRPFTVHWCNWTGAEATISLWFRLGADPALGDDPPVDLGGGVTAREQTEQVAGELSCTLEWKHRPFPGTDVEVVTLTLRQPKPENDENACAPAHTVAKSVVSALAGQ